MGNDACIRSAIVRAGNPTMLAVNVAYAVISLLLVWPASQPLRHTMLWELLQRFTWADAVAAAGRAERDALTGGDAAVAAVCALPAPHRCWTAAKAACRNDGHMFGIYQSDVYHSLAPAVMRLAR
jgi:hypothetical protein